MAWWSEFAWQALSALSILSSVQIGDDWQPDEFPWLEFCTAPCRMWRLTAERPCLTQKTLCVAPQINRPPTQRDSGEGDLRYCSVSDQPFKSEKGLIVFSKSVKGCRWWTNGCVWLSDLREVQPEGNFEGFFDLVLDGSVILFFSGLQSDSIKFELSNLITN